MARVDAARPDLGGYLRLELMNVAGSGDIYSVELKESQVSAFTCILSTVKGGRNLIIVPRPVAGQEGFQRRLPCVFWSCLVVK